MSPDEIFDFSPVAIMAGCALYAIYRLGRRILIRLKGPKT